MPRHSVSLLDDARARSRRIRLAMRSTIQRATLGPVGPAEGATGTPVLRDYPYRLDR